MNFLSHTISAAGIRPHITRVEVVRTFPVPQDKKALHQFVGLINYYHCFVPKCAEIVQPLHLALADDSFIWTASCQQASEAAKTALSEAVMLVHPQPHAATCIKTDASNHAVGAVLEQFIHGQWKPISFFSKKLNCWLLTLLSDTSCILLKAMFSISTPITSPLLLRFTPVLNGIHHGRHLAVISEFMTDLCHIEGQANRVADALSRNVLALEQSPLDLDAFASAQEHDEELLQLSTSPTSLKLAQVFLSHSGRTLLCDISQGHPRPVVPLAMRRAIFDKLLSLSHPDIKASRRLISEQ